MEIRFNVYIWGKWYGLTSVRERVEDTLYKDSGWTKFRALRDNGDILYKVYHKDCIEYNEN